MGKDKVERGMASQTAACWISCTFWLREGGHIAAGGRPFRKSRLGSHLGKGKGKPEKRGQIGKRDDGVVGGACRRAMEKRGPKGGMIVSLKIKRRRTTTRREKVLEKVEKTIRGHSFGKSC